MSLRSSSAVLAKKLERYQSLLQDKRDFIRMRAVLLVLRGATVGLAASSLGCTRQAVNKWLRLYRSSGDPATLTTQPRSGRPQLAQELTKEIITQALALDPLRLGYGVGSWTVDTLAYYLGQHKQIDIRADTLRRRLHHWGFRYKRPRYVYEEKEPNLAQKKGRSSVR